MNFSEALELLKEGESLTRMAWLGKDKKVFLPIDHTRYRHLPYFVLECNDYFMPWVCNSGDLLADDWERAV